MPFIHNLAQSIDDRISALTSEIATLEAARAALRPTGSERPARRQTPQSRTPRTSRRKATKTTKQARSSSVLLADQAERLLASTNGKTTAALAKQAGAKHDQVLALLRDLEKARRVRRSGQRRTTRWHAITDEDRIRERAADLAGRTKQRSK